MELNNYYRVKRRRNLARRFLGLFSVGAIFLLAVWGFFWIPYFRISKIEAEVGDYDKVGLTIKNYLSSLNAAFLPRNNFFLFSSAEIERLIKDRGFGLADVSKNFPKTLVVKFEKSRPWLIFCSSEKNCYYLDERGILSEASPQFSENPIPQIEGVDAPNAKLGDRILSYEDAIFVRAWFQNLKKLEAEPANILLEKGNNLKIFLKEGWFIYVSKKLSTEKNFYDLKLLFDKKIKDRRPELEYIDLRFENKAFYKLR